MIRYVRPGKRSLERSISVSYLVPVATGAVAGVLLMGLINMLRGGSADLSQKLMRWRVGLQFLAIIVIMAVIWWRGG